MFFGISLSWYDAEKYCLEKGMHLASIQTMDELEYLNKRYGYGSGIWVGGLMDSNRQFTWTDESPWCTNNENVLSISKFRPTPTKNKKYLYWFILCFRPFGAFYKKNIFPRSPIIRKE